MFPRVRALLIALAALVVLPAPAVAAPIYGLFVGIGAYPKASGVAQLSGPRADVAAIKAVLVERYGLDPKNTRTLFDDQATRAEILKALNGQIQQAAATPGATVVFYYSGHGGEVSDARGDQRSGANSTLVPYDARGGGVVRDILDIQLDQIIETARGWGVNVVTIFDSCNSATATRGVRPRHVRAVGPTEPGAELDRQTPPLILPPGLDVSGRAPGLRIHMAAAQDHEVAGESPEAGDQWRGDFTRALEIALREHPGATYEDLSRIVAHKLATQGVTQQPNAADAPLHERQQPHAEGAITTRFLGSDTEDLPLYVATLQGGEYVVDGGTLANVTQGSTFAAYPTVQAAREKKALGSGTIAEASETRARLQLAAALPTRPERLYLLETSHIWPANRLLVGVDAPAEARERLQALVRAQPFAALEAAHPQVIIQHTGGGERLLDAYGTPLTDLYASDDALAEALSYLAGYRRVLSLAEAAPGPKLTLDIVAACDNGAYCPSLQRQEGDVVVPAGAKFRLVAKNDSGQPLYIYGLDLEPNFSIRALTPRTDQQGEAEKVGGDPLVVVGATARLGNRFCSVTPAEREVLLRNERTWFAVIASDARVPVELLQQKGVQRPREVGQATGTDSPLARLIADARLGARDIPAKPAVWTVRTISLRVLPPEPAPACPSQAAAR